MVDETHRRPDAGDLLLLDLDGTIADITADPHAAAIDEEAKRALARMVAADPAGIVIITGRSLADADRMLIPLRLAILASHGAEVRVPGVSAAHGLAGIEDVRGPLGALAAQVPGVAVEWKPFSAAIHFRQAPDAEPAVREGLEAFVTAWPHYRIQPGRMVYEVVPETVSKARAVAWLMTTPCYAARRAIYVGDDRADEAAMAVVEARGGTALRVAGEYFNADVARFENAAAVRAWLGRMAERAALSAD